MKIVKSLLAATALVASIGASASAQVIGATLGAPAFPFINLTGSGACGACALTGVATISGGSVLSADQMTADANGFSFVPGGLQGGGRFLAAGQGAVGQPSTLSFTIGIDYVSFLWGSPDLFNRLTVNTNTGGPQTFVAGPVVAPAGTTSLNLGNQSGSQGFAQYVSFTAINPGTIITSLVFSNSPADNNSFEAANFSVRQVPEPSNVALMAAGLAALGLISRRRKLS